MSNSLSDMTFEQLLAYSKKQQKELDEKKSELDEKKSELDEKKSELDEKKSELDEKKSELDEKKSELDEKKSELDEKKSELDEKKSELEDQRAEIDLMRFEIGQLKRLLFGAKRERFVPMGDSNQLTLPFEIKPQEEAQEKQTVTYSRKKAKRENHPGRLTLPSHLPVEEIIIEPKADTNGMKCIGKEITDKLEFEPGKLYIKRYIRPKYIQSENSKELTHKGVIAELPSFPIEKGIPEAGLLSQIMIDKFVDHLPIYRQIERFKREGIKLPSSTINGWQEAVCNLLEPLYQVLKNRVLSQGYIQADETPIGVLDRNKKGKTHRGYHWVYYSPLEKTVLFDYRKGRSREGPTELLKNFKGYLQSDGYVVYDSFAKKEGITLLNCMAHARRGFEKALDYDREKAEYAMGMFQQLYAVERKAKEQELSAEKRYELRLEKSLPILNELGKWMAQTYKSTLPKSALGKAMAYCIPRWDKLMAYLHDGSLEIDNNLVENSIRPVAIGRKNYLFAGSHNGAKRAAMMYSFLGTCKKNEVNPFLWLKQTLQVIPDHKANKLHELLPHNFIPKK